MERLTFEGNFCDIAQCTNTPGGSFCEDGSCSARKVWERLKAYEDTHMMPSDVTSMRMDMAIIAALFNGVDVDRMKELAEADKAGCVVVLPAKTVYELTWDAGPGCDLRCPISVGGSGLCDFCDKGKLFIYERTCTQELLKELGKTVFLTREEAEEAMEERTNEGNA